MIEENLFLVGGLLCSDLENSLIINDHYVFSNKIIG
jgi:hypothetical protein